MEKVKKISGVGLVICLSQINLPYPTVINREELYDDAEIKAPEHSIFYDNLLNINIADL